MYKLPKWAPLLIFITLFALSSTLAWLFVQPDLIENHATQNIHQLDMTISSDDIQKSKVNDEGVSDPLRYLLTMAYYKPHILLLLLFGSIFFIAFIVLILKKQH